MGFFSRLLGHHDDLPPVPANAIPIPSAPPRQIGYDPRLVDSMLKDHAHLGQIFGSIGDAQKAGNYGDIRTLLVNFKSRLEAHVLTENVRFYNYLEQSLANDPANASVMHDFRREMNGIARAVIDFVKKYQSSQFTPEERRQFALDYDAVGKVLVQRMDNEESNLYPLYQPN